MNEHIFSNLGILRVVQNVGLIRGERECVCVCERQRGGLESTTTGVVQTIFFFPPHLTRGPPSREIPAAVSVQKRADYISR